MDEYVTGEIIESEGLLSAMVPGVVCLKGSKNCTPVQFLIDTGSNRSIITFEDGNRIGFEAPHKDEQKHYCQTASGNRLPYVMRRADVRIGDKVLKNRARVCWCTLPRLTNTILGMDFFDEYKLIIKGGKHKRFYIAPDHYCVDCNEAN